MSLLGGGGQLPNQTALQALLMNAQYYPDEMKKIREAMEKRMAEQKAANYTGMGAAGSYGKQSLEGMVANKSNQQAPSSLGSLMEGRMPMQDVGNSSSIQSIWDALRF
jgi:hypothetical protein